MQAGVQRSNIVSIFVSLVFFGFLICVGSPASPSAGPAVPNFYYYSSGRKYALVLSKEKLAVRFKQGLTLEQQKQVVESEPVLGLFSQREESPTFRITFLALLEGVIEEDVIEALKRLNARLEVEAAYPIFNFPHREIVLTEEFIVKFDPNVSEAEIDAFNALNCVEVARKLRWTELYVLRVKDPKNMNTLEIANMYYENPITIFSVPNFIGRTEKLPSVTADDTYFPEQWPLDNTGQTGGTPDADIDAPEGWEISTGSSDILIAVLDSGVDLTHEDLVDNLVGGYDACDDNNDPSPGAHWRNAHGTACAGLAAAHTNNRIGIAGVSWNCKIMPIRVFKFEQGKWWDRIDWYINAINWAVNNGADVLSCSWATLSDDQNLHDTISNAKDNGRNGKGCVLVFAADNWNEPIGYPARYDEVIAVGGSDANDVRWPWSNFGHKLDVVAPSGDGGIDYTTICWSTDISGPNGYNTGDINDGDANGHYTKWMGGTSGATPKVAGLAGLILSVNPDLTADEVQFIIQSTADDRCSNHRLSA